MPSILPHNLPQSAVANTINLILNQKINAPIPANHTTVSSMPEHLGQVFFPPNGIISSAHEHPTKLISTEWSVPESRAEQTKQTQFGMRQSQRQTVGKVCGRDTIGYVGHQTIPYQFQPKFYQFNLLYTTRVHLLRNI